MFPGKPADDLIIDADAHVVECAHTWDFMDPSEKQFRPIPLETREEAGVKLQFWVIDGKVRDPYVPGRAIEDDKAAMLWRNAERFYKLPL